MTFRLFTMAMIIIAHGSLAHAQVERRGRVFDVRSLFDERGIHELVMEAPCLREPWSLGLELASPAENDGDGSTGWDMERLVALIQRTIAPDSWRNSRNSLEARDGRLTVVQTPDVLEKIDSLLTLLETREARTFGIDLAMVPPESLEKAAPLSLRPGSSPWLDGDVLDRAVAADPARAAVLCAQAAEGAPARLQPPAVALLLGDLEVNQTGVTPVTNPVVEPAFLGLHAEVVVRSGPVDGRLRVDLELGRAGLRGKPERRRVLGADLDLPVTEREQAGTSLAVEDGRTALVGFFSPGPSAQGGPGDMKTAAFAVLLRVRGSTPAAAGQPAPFLPGLIEAGVLLFEPRDHSIQGLPAARRSDSEAAPREDLLLGAAAAALDPANLDAARERISLAHGAVLVGGGDEDARKIRVELARLARERLRMVTLDLWQGEAESGELAGAAGSSVLLDPSWIERIGSRPGLRARLTGVRGARMSLASVVARSCITDVNMVSGGTGMHIAVAADPEVEAIGAGLILDAACDIVPGEPWAQLEVSGELARPPVFGRQARARSSLEVKPAPAGDRMPIEATAEWVLIDLPDEDTDLWRHLLTAPLGRPVLLNALPDSSSPGKTRALVAVVHETPLP